MLTTRSTALRLLLSSVVATALLAPSMPALAQTGIAYVQSNAAVPQQPESVVTAAFTAAQTTGNLNVVVVGINDSSSLIASVTDTAGNAYVRAVGPTTRLGFGSQSIYYAKNILGAAAGANVVTVTFNQQASYVDLRIGEYAGLDRVNPLDVVMAAQGSSTTTNSGSVTTTYPNDLLVGGNLVATRTSNPGTGYTRRLITVPDGDILEDRVVTAIGSYNATAPVSPSGAWIMQMVAFRGAPTGPPDTEAPTVPGSLSAVAASSTQVNLSWAASTDNVAVSNYLIERCQSAGCSVFAQVATSTGLTFNNTGLTASTSYSYRVRAIDPAGNTSGYSGIATAATPAPPDTTAPTAPSGLSTTAASGSQINLSWTASTDNVGVSNYLIERCQGAACTTWAQVGTSTVTTFSSTGLTPSTTYRFRVRATDAAGNNSGYSSIATAATPAPPDTQAPTAPGSLTATPASSTQINLNWTASADNVAVTNYLIERCQDAGCSGFAQVATSTSLTLNNTGLAASTSYSYRVRATDAAGNVGLYSNTATASTPAPPDTESPTAPGSLSATAVSSSQVNLGWTASTDNVGVTNYLIERCQNAGCSVFAQISTSATLTFNNTGLNGATSYSYRVRAADAAGNTSAYSNTATVTTSAPPDTQSPSTPTGLSTTTISDTQINLTWTASTDNVGVTNYLIERCQDAGCSVFAQVGTSATAAFGSTSLIATTSYSYRVRATDAAGNLSGYSNVATATTLATPDFEAPSAPSSLTATPFNSTQINLAWTGSTDNIAVTNYLIERCQGASCSTFLQAATVTGLTFSNTGLSPLTSYSYRVRATDAAANQSGYSNVSSAVTPAAPDTQAPTTPTGVTATPASTTEIGLTWTASTDNVAVTNYLIERCQGSGCASFVQVGTAAASPFADTALAVSTLYRYRIRATDASANTSAYSTIVQATTLTPPDTQAPSTPSTLTATPITSSQIALSWTASTDNVAVTSYLIERCQGAGCSTFVQINTSATSSFSDLSVSGGTNYTYRIRATDAAANLSGYSNAASATTPATPTISFIQTNNAVPQSSTAVVAVPFTLPQTAGNLNVVVVGWNSSSGQVQSVVDNRGNIYTLAVGPTVQLGFASQSIYYAANIAPSAANNTVTVTFNGAMPYPDIRIAEYSGIAQTSPVDVVAGGVGSSSLSSSGAVTTTNANDLIVGANIVSSFTSGPGASFTSRVITVPDGDILEDRVVSAVGSYSATAPLSSGTWIMQMVAFKAGSSGPDLTAPTAPTLTTSAVSGGQINLSWTAATDNVGVTQYAVERCLGAACSNFASIATLGGATLNYSDAGLAPNTAYSYRVRAADNAANVGPYSNVSFTTTLAPDTELPSATGTLTTTAVSGTQIEVSWGAATDNVGVTGYRLERCQGVGCTAFNKLGTTITGTSFSDSGLSLDTSYSYIVRAQDAAGNLGPYSNVSTAVTLTTNPSLVGAYSFDEGVGTIINDLSGRGNVGTATSITWATTGKFGKALLFNGSSSLVTIPDAPSLRLTTGMTLEAWVNPAVANFGWRDIIYKGNDNYYLEGATPSGVPMVGITVGASQTEVFGTTQLAPNTWTFLAATYDGINLRYYINGTQVGSQPRTGPIITSANPLQIGGDSIWGQYFQGMIDEVRVYDVALTPGQIQADMANAVGGSSPALSLNTISLNFGNQTVGTASAPQAISVTNGGTLTLSLSSIGISGPQGADFSPTNSCPATLAPFASCTINVVFTPSNGGTRNGSLIIANNAPGNPHSISLTGVGTGFGITPQTSVLTLNQTQQFVVSGAGGSGVVWSVDGVVGGTPAVGTVSAAGLYTPPAASGSHSVQVATTDGTKSASATAYVTTHAGVFTHHNDNQRTGQNLAETVLTHANVNTASFGKRANYPIDGIAHAAPLYVTGVNIPAVGRRNVVYVATEHDSVYAFDADAAGGSPLWHVSFINPGGGITTVPNGDTGECCDIAPEIGITGTPVIDTSTNTLYVVAKTKEGANSYPQRLHALDLATGAEKFGGPVVITASVPGSGTGSSGGTLSFNSLRENERTALLLHNGVVYFGFGSHGDNQPYHGWLLGYNATTLQRVVTFSSTPNGEGGGIWQSGGGLAIDSAGNFYFATGDGTFSVNTGGIDYGDTFIKYNPAGGVLDYFTPHDQANLDANNLDLDAGGMILLPDQSGAHPHLLVSAGKNGSIYVVDRDNMTHFHATDQNVQTLVNVFPFGTPLPGNYSSPVYFNGTVYFAPVADVIQAFKLTSGLLSTAPTSTTPQAYSYPGGSLAISANGTNDGILWAVQKNGAAPGVLRAYDASNLAFELYNSEQAGGRDVLDVAAKFAVPIVVNGKVFVATEGSLTVYGLLP